MRCPKCDKKDCKCKNKENKHVNMKIKNVADHVVKRHKPKIPKGLLLTLILMPFLIGFMTGFYITLNIPIQLMQSYITDFDSTLTDTFNNIQSGFGG